MSNEDELQGIEHLDHCIDLLRQSLMVWFNLVPMFIAIPNAMQCSVDIAPLTFARKKRGDSGKAVAEVIHGCRSFIEVQRWALNRRFDDEIDLTSIVTDDPLKWGTNEY